MEQAEQTYRHYKGNVYTLITDQAIREADLVRLVVYRDRTGRIWVRPFEDFHALVKTSGGGIVPRFEPVTLLRDKEGLCEPECSEDKPCGELK